MATNEDDGFETLKKILFDTKIIINIIQYMSCNANKFLQTNITADTYIKQ